MRKTLKVQISLLIRFFSTTDVFVCQPTLKSFWLYGNPYATSTDAWSAGTGSLMCWRQHTKMTFAALVKATELFLLHDELREGEW